MTSLQLFTLLFLLVCGHAIGDFALQTEWMATNKDRNVRLKYPPEERAKLQLIWPYLLTAHALHHGLIVFLITQKLSLGVAETVIHWCSDFAKCERWYGFHADQLVHVSSKLLWAGLIYGQVV